MMLRVEAELPLRRVTFPPQLDHAWAFATSAVHARPFVLHADGSLSPQAAHVEQVSEDTVALYPAAEAGWTDGRRLTIDELARCVARGFAAIASLDTAGLQREADRLLVRTPLGLERLARLLATAAFSLTPCIRDSPAHQTSGPYAIVGIGNGGRTMDLRRRSGTDQPGAAHVRIISTESVGEGRAMLGRGELDLTRVLGGRPSGLDKNLNSEVDLVMGLRFADTSPLAQELPAHLVLSELANGTGGTYRGLATTAVSRTRTTCQEPLTLQYTDYYPNKIVATNIVQQLSRRGISCRLHSVDYHHYLRGEAPVHGAQLEIIDPVFGMGRGFIPLLQAVSTLSSSSRIKVDRPLVNARAEIDWEQIHWGEEC